MFEADKFTKGVGPVEEDAIRGARFQPRTVMNAPPTSRRRREGDYSRKVGGVGCSVDQSLRTVIKPPELITVTSRVPLWGGRFGPTTQSPLALLA